jgi:hypothetical protein
MAAGLGFKTFTTGEVLTAADVNGYLMQGILVFATEAARDSAITSPQEGQFAFTKDNNSLWYYTGSAWVASGATGDIEGVTAGVGISGGGTSGTVTITNSMATAIDAKGDLVAGTGADTFSRLAVGANDTVLTADSSTATGLKWATPASGGMTLIASGTLSGTTVSLTSIPGTYENLIIYMRDVTGTAVNGANLQVNSNGVVRAVEERNLTGVYQVQSTTAHAIFQNIATTNTDAHAFIFIPDYSSSSVALAESHSYVNSGGQTYLGVRSVFPATTTAITSVQLDAPSGFSGGTYELWGQK